MHISERFINELNLNVPSSDMDAANKAGRKMVYHMKKGNNSRAAYYRAKAKSHLKAHHTRIKNRGK